MTRKVGEKKGGAKAAKKSGTKTAPAAAKAKLFTLPKTDKKCFLHIGSGIQDVRKIPPQLRGAEWLEIRLDPRTQVSPDIVAPIHNLSMIPDNALDAVWLPHVLPRLYASQVMTFLKECRRVLKAGGSLVGTFFNFSTLSRMGVEDKLEDSSLKCIMGNLTAHEMIFGPIRNLSQAEIEMSAFHSGYTMRALGKLLIKQQFQRVQMRFEDYDVWLLAHKPVEGADLSKEVITYYDGKRLRREQEGEGRPASNQVDELDRPPVLWKPLNLNKKSA